MRWLEASNLAVFNRVDIHTILLDEGVVGAHDSGDFSFAAGLEGVGGQGTNASRPHNENFSFWRGHCDEIFRTG